MRIRAAVARAGAPLRIEDCELAEPGAHEVAVVVEACGICHTDLSAHDGAYGTPLPAVLGHEGVGRISALGAGVRGFAVGDRVLMSFGACGECPACRERTPGYCRHAHQFNLLGRRLDGSSPISVDGRPITGHFFGQSSFATHAVAAATNLVKLDEDLPAAAMVPLACGVQTGVGAVVHVLEAGPGDSLAVFGCGTVGLAAVMAAKIVGCARVVAVDRRADRLALALGLGATHTVDTARPEGEAALGELRGLTLAFDSTGSPALLAAALAALRSRGRLVLAGLSPKGATLALDPNRLMAGGRTLRGTVEGDADPPTFIPRMIAWYRQGSLPVDRLVTTYPFERIDAAVADMRAGRAIKPVLQMRAHSPVEISP